MKPGQQFDISQITNILRRWKFLIAAVLVVISALSAYLAYNLRNVYRSTTVILVTPQSLPSAYVSSTVTLNVEQRVMAIAQQIQGRTVLEKIVKEFDLFPGPRATLEERAERLRKRIKLEFTQFTRNHTFSLSFDAENPQKAMEVTARLASLFIEENLKAREQQAAGTTTFLNAEAERLRKELEEQESQVNLFRVKHRYELPEQLDSNLRLLDQLRRQLENGTLRVSALQERRAGLEKQIAEVELIGRDLDMIQGMDPGGAAGPGIGLGPIDVKRKELEILRRQYSEKHPDVVRLVREIQALEAEKPAVQAAVKKTAPVGPIVAPRLSLKDTLSIQVTDLKSQIDALAAVNEKLRAEIASYQGRIDNTPLRSTEITNITRNYNITLSKYQDILRKTLDSELSENMEKKQKGEQFQVVDRANLPQIPVAPNRPRLIILGVVLGLGAGLGSAFLLEMLNTSFKRTEDLDGYSDVPLLATLPMIETRGQIIAQRQQRGMLILIAVSVLAIGLMIIPKIAPSLPVF
jgi:polysaccharide chain length determinant protein (PEP-CTERM system associated)